MYRRFRGGGDVVERTPRLIAREDDEISAAIADILAAEGITVRPARVHHSLLARPGVSVGVNCRQGAPSIAGSHVLLAFGRRPNTDGPRSRSRRRRHRRPRLHHRG
jgi:pyruvate/2-oxoglutarate dehydrogenase complex dihydrolipoamide dehydrogenase (E3) component